MTEYWKSQAKKFCDFCKCWIADNKAVSHSFPHHFILKFSKRFHVIFQSISFHENGRRHQQAVENRLYEIKRKGKKDDLKAKREEDWLKDIERKAMNDYRSKDLGNNADITAKIFNQKRSEMYEHEASTSEKAQFAAQCAELDKDLAGVAGGSTAQIGPQIQVPKAMKDALSAAGAKWEG